MKSTLHIQRTYNLLLSLFWLATALPLSLSVLLFQARGLDLFQIGVAMGVYSLTIVILEVPTGGLADAIGRKRAAVIAYACLMGSSALLLFAFSFPAVLIAFIFYGVGRALSSGALDAWFVDALQAVDPQVDLQPYLARAGTFSFLALGVGTLLGSAIPVLFKALPVDGSAVLTPFSMPILFALGLKLLLVVLTSLLVQEDRAGAHQGSWRRGFADVPRIVRTGFRLSRDNPILLLLLGATAAGGLALAGLENFWQPNFANLLGGSAGKSLFFGAVMGGSFLAGMLGNWLATPLSRRLKGRYALVCTIFQGGWGLAVLLLAIQLHPLPAAVAFWLAYLNIGILNSPHSTLLNAEIPSEARSSMLSIASLAGYLGSMLGSIGLGYIAKHASIGLAWGIGGAVLVVSLALYWKIDLRQAEQRTSLPETLTDAA